MPVAHWCNVMNRESFSEAETAALINDNFIPILADREERPDLDMLYQGAAGIMSHPGGWPLNMFLKPDGTPYWATGYMHFETKPDSPSFRAVLTDTAELWKTDRARVDDGHAAEHGHRRAEDDTRAVGSIYTRGL